MKELLRKLGKIGRQFCYKKSTKRFCYKLNTKGLAMNDEQAEKIIEKGQLVGMTLGLLTDEAYEDFKWSAAAGLKKFGGAFAVKLGELLEVADVNNSIKILKLWYSLCEEHVWLYRAFVAKQKAEEAQNG